MQGKHAATAPSDASTITTPGNATGVRTSHVPSAAPVRPRHAAPDAEYVIEIRDLVKSFGSFRALDRLDLQLRRGEVLGFLGPNGAGKSTTIRTLLGLLRADSGTMRLFGQDPWKDSVELHKRLAYVPGDVSLWPTMTGGEAIDLLGSLRGGLDGARRADTIERLELDPTKRGRQYSKGNRQKVALVAALASDAELLILDEPTSGLDPLMEDVFQQLVREAVDRGASVLLSSHIMSEVQNLADRVSVIRSGRIIYDATTAELDDQLAGTGQDLEEFFLSLYSQHDGGRAAVGTSVDTAAAVDPAGVVAADEER